MQERKIAARGTRSRAQEPDISDSGAIRHGVMLQLNEQLVLDYVHSHGTTTRPEIAASLGIELLRPGGSFVVKVFDGQDAHDYVQRLRPHFEKVKRVKPEATRRESVEFFVVCTGRKTT